jgi:hypothetical protein
MNAVLCKQCIADRLAALVKTIGEMKHLQELQQLSYAGLGKLP